MDAMNLSWIDVAIMRCVGITVLWLRFHLMRSSETPIFILSACVNVLAVVVTSCWCLFIRFLYKLLLIFVAVEFLVSITMNRVTDITLSTNAENLLNNSKGNVSTTTTTSLGLYPRSTKSNLDFRLTLERFTNIECLSKQFEDTLEPVVRMSCMIETNSSRQLACFRLTYFDKNSSERLNSINSLPSRVSIFENPLLPCYSTTPVACVGFFHRQSIGKHVGIAGLVSSNGMLVVFASGLVLVVLAYFQCVAIMRPVSRWLIVGASVSCLAALMIFDGTSSTHCVGKSLILLASVALAFSVVHELASLNPDFDVELTQYTVWWWNGKKESSGMRWTQSTKPMLLFGIESLRSVSDVPLDTTPHDDDDDNINDEDIDLYDYDSDDEGDLIEVESSFDGMDVYMFCTKDHNPINEFRVTFLDRWRMNPLFSWSLMASFTLSAKLLVIGFDAPPDVSLPDILRTSIADMLTSSLTHFGLISLGSHIASFLSLSGNAFFGLVRGSAQPLFGLFKSSRFLVYITLAVSCFTFDGVLSDSIIDITSLIGKNQVTSFEWFCHTFVGILSWFVFGNSLWGTVVYLRLSSTSWNEYIRALFVHIGVLAGVPCVAYWMYATLDKPLLILWTMGPSFMLCGWVCETLIRYPLFKWIRRTWYFPREIIKDVARIISIITGFAVTLLVNWHFIRVMKLTSVYNTTKVALVFCFITLVNGLPVILLSMPALTRLYRQRNRGLHVVSLPMPTLSQLTGVRDYDASCPICLDTMPTTLNVYQQVLVATPCGHIFHRKCLSEWVVVKQICPKCRRKIS